MKALTALAMLLVTMLPQVAAAESWVEVGADPEAKFYIDLDSLAMVNDALRVIKRGIYNHSLTERFSGQPVMFRETRGIVEMDCELRVNRVSRIDMLDETGAVVWSSGDMPRRLWLSVKPNSHAETTLDVACAAFQQI